MRRGPEKSKHNVSHPGTTTNRPSTNPPLSHPLGGTRQKNPAASSGPAPSSPPPLDQSLNEFIFVLDSEGIIRTLWTGNDAILKKQNIFLLGQRFDDAIGEKACASFKNLFRQVLASRQPAASEFPCVLANGALRALRVLMIPVLDEKRAVVRLVGTARDVTGRQDAERRLRHKEAILAQAEQLANMGSWERNLQTGELIWSEQRYRMAGLDPYNPPVTLEILRQLVHPDDRARVWSDIDRAIDRREIADTEYRIVLPGGQIRTMHRRAVPVCDEEGNPVRLVGMTQDITERKAEEDRLRKSEALLAQAEQIARMGSFVLDIPSNTLDWSDQLYRNVGLTRDSGPIHPEIFRRMVHPDDRERVVAEIDEAVARSETIESEFRVILPNGEIRALHRRAVPIRDDSGKAVRLVGVAQDVTERKAEGERLRRSEDLLSQAEEIANFGSWEYNFETRRYTLSRQLLAMYGFESEQQWDEDAYWHRLAPGDRELAREISGRGIAECKPYEFVARYRMPDGTSRIYHSQAVPIPGKDGTPARVRGVVRDITEQTRVEDDLHRLSQELIRLRDAERRQLAHELHESAGQTLASLKMILGNLGEMLPEDGAAREILQTARQFADDAVREIRVVSYLMHPAMLDESGLGPALRWYSKGFSERSGIATTVEVPENFGRQRQEIEMTIFRIVQEALTNVHRYSGSQTATVRLALESARLLVSIEDEGCGLPSPGSLAPRNAPFGVGIAGMRERVKQLHGIFEIESVPGRGTTVRAILPLSPDGEPDSWIVSNQNDRQDRPVAKEEPCLEGGL
ncbi:MAG TPA: PAS domain-containing protein [Candidatus Acidoferrales bacterium]|nr:PAS domain-containing protein [Candidatus Acidoferrales bacterium]